MRKLVLMLATAMMAVSMNAQNTATTGNKEGDNWYIGINAGVATPMTKFDNPATGESDWGGFLKGFAPSAGLRIGKNLTTVFGVAADAKVFFEATEKSGMKQTTFVDAVRANLLATFNLSNLFAGYKGQPRGFELIALAGPGWMHNFGTVNKENALIGTAALDFAFNFGCQKQWQFYVEPAVNFMLCNWVDNTPVKHDMKFDNRYGLYQVSLGLNYKFNTSNDTHNFAKVALMDKSEIDALNAQINSLRAESDDLDGQMANADKTITNLKKQLNECMARPVGKIIEKKENNTLQPIVIFRQGKSTIDKPQYASVEMVANYMNSHKDERVVIRGYASPEGSADLNQKLSENRAKAVKEALVKRYKIAADRIEVEGMGATDQLSEENDFNRVAMFIVK